MTSSAVTSTSTLTRPAPAVSPTAPAHVTRPRSRVLRGRDDDPAWVRPSLIGMLLATALVYLWRLSDSGYANTFYAAAVQAGSKSWTALLFGSLDAGNAITVDKPPASLWVMGLSARIFGFSSWSLLVPQALIGVASVALLYAAVRRRFGPGAGLLAGGILALTPVAALMFRFDNPDALLVLLMVAGAYATLRAMEKASTRWLALAGVALGFAFLTKMLQGFLVLPGFALAYLVAAPTTLGRRLWQLLLAGGAVVVSAGWFIALVAVWPASSRPYIGGSTDNSLLELALGYNGLGRLTGSDGPGGGGGNTSAAFGGESGLGRLFGASMGTEISWLLPAALVALVAGLWFTRRAPRTDTTRAALLLWGGWLLVTGLVFSFMGGITHPYYSVAAAPAIGALVAIGAAGLWRGRAAIAARATLAGMVLVTGVWTFALLARTPAWLPWLRWVLLVAAGVAAAGVLIQSARRWVAPAILTLALTSGLVGTGAYTLATAATPHGGSIPTSGPSSAGTGQGAGGAMGGGETSSALTALLVKSTATWAAAVSGSQSAATLELSSGQPVMALGGWSGSDPSPTLAQFEQYVADGRIGYFISGGGMGGGGMGGGNSAISTWVGAHYTATTVGGTTVYDLSKPSS